MSPAKATLSFFNFMIAAATSVQVIESEWDEDGGALQALLMHLGVRHQQFFLLSELFLACLKRQIFSIAALKTSACSRKAVDVMLTVILELYVQVICVTGLGLTGSAFGCASCQGVQLTIIGTSALLQTLEHLLCILYCDLYYVTLTPGLLVSPLSVCQAALLYTLCCRYLRDISDLSPNSSRELVSSKRACGSTFKFHHLIHSLVYIVVSALGSRVLRRVRQLPLG